ncbi:hypothetical protein CH380_06655 [Leptospira adleri]|uniref:Uncharacterized protein n=1 Tax=Leptospira adleri TaxID=2023186 RepID=A0A2M9YRM9_9LEPT|nr:hypothetical protein CH380_06655 [Leptospira adleri]PJZ62344.1 hypothetical protein CH376_08265 [Leptospira adleri]
MDKNSIKRNSFLLSRSKTDSKIDSKNPGKFFAFQFRKKGRFFHKRISKREVLSDQISILKKTPRCVGTFTFFFDKVNFRKSAFQKAKWQEKNLKDRRKN